MPYFPTQEETKYECKGCGGWFYPGAVCMVQHSPGTCCHKYEKPVSPGYITIRGNR